MKSLGVILLLCLQVSGALASLDGASLRCVAPDEASLVATLTESPQFGLIAVVNDGYDSTQLLRPGPRGSVWMDCHVEARDLVCPGHWQFRQDPTVVRFHRDLLGKITVTFRRDLLHYSYEQTLPCQITARN